MERVRGDAVGPEAVRQSQRILPTSTVPSSVPPDGLNVGVTGTLTAAATAMGDGGEQSRESDSSQGLPVRRLPPPNVGLPPEKVQLPRISPLHTDFAAQEPTTHFSSC